MQEKRRFKRLDVNLPVTLRYAGRLIPATILNISSGGVCLSVENAKVAEKESKKVEVVIDLSEEVRDVALRGEITRVEPGSTVTLGIKFTNLYSVGHQTLEEFINSSLN